jgi:hypothetical protein
MNRPFWAGCPGCGPHQIGRAKRTRRRSSITPPGRPAIAGRANGITGECRNRTYCRLFPVLRFCTFSGPFCGFGNARICARIMLY